MPARPGSRSRRSAGRRSSSGSRRSPPPPHRATRARPWRSTSRSRPATSTTRFIGASRRLAPCGTGNPEPLVAVLGLTVTRSREAAGGHTQLTLKRRLDVLDGIAFGRSDLATTVNEGDVVDVVGRLTSRTFGGFESLQLEIRDVATSGSHSEAAAILGLAQPTAAARRAGGDPLAAAGAPA